MWTYEDGYDAGYETGFEDGQRSALPSSPDPSTQGVPAQEVSGRG